LANLKVKILKGKINVSKYKSSLTSNISNLKVTIKLVLPIESNLLSNFVESGASKRDPSDVKGSVGVQVAILGVVSGNLETKKDIKTSLKYN